MELLLNPTIKLTFSGLFLLCFGEKLDAQKHRRCEIGVVNIEDHCLKITVKHVTLQGGTVTHAVLPAELLTADINFKILDRPEEVDIFFGSPDFPRRWEQDFRWIVDLEGGEFHGKKLQIKDTATFRRIFVRQGQFHTAKKHSVRIKPPRAAAFLSNVAQVIGCNVVLNQNEKAVLSYGANKLEFPRLENTSYLIEVENLCQPSASDPGNGDFRRLYDVLMVDEADKFDVLPPPPGVESPGRPCDEGYLSEHTTLDDRTA